MLPFYPQPQLGRYMTDGCLTVVMDDDFTSAHDRDGAARCEVGGGGHNMLRGGGGGGLDVTREKTRFACMS